MSNVNFNNILYMSPQVMVYPDYAIIKTKDFSDLDRIFEMCGVVRDLDKPTNQSETQTIIPLKNKE